MTDKNLSLEFPELPKNWMWTTIGEAFQVHVGATPSRKEPAYWNGDIPWVSSGEVKFCRICETRERITRLGLSKSSTTLHPPGTILLGMIGEGKTRGQTAILNIEACNNQNSAAIRVSDTEVVPAYIYYFLEGEYDRTRRLSSGNNQPALNKTRVQAMKFPLAPLAEQHRIVNKIEELFTELDAGVALLKKLKRKLKRYRQAVLKAAVEGKLTQDWREAHQDELEPASVLLERILAERREKWEAEQLAKMEAKGKVPKNDKWKLKYKEPAAPDTTNLAKLPNGWIWIDLNSVISNIEAGKSFKCEQRPPELDEIGVAKVSAVSWGEYKELESKTCIDKEKINPQFFIQKDDFLFSRANTIDLVGACVIVKKVERKVMLSDKTLRLAFIEFPDAWALINLRSRHGRDEIERLATGNQDSMRNIGQERIRSIRVPLPSLQEISQITEEVDFQLSIVDELDKVFHRKLVQAEKLRQSILKRAFEGNLVLQDPADEPASTLLERIQKEKEQKQLAEKKAKKTSRKKKTKTKKTEQLELIEASLSKEPM